MIIANLSTIGASTDYMRHYRDINIGTHCVVRMERLAEKLEDKIGQVIT